MVRIGSKRRRSEPISRLKKVKLDKKIEKNLALPAATPKSSKTEEVVLALADSSEVRQSNHPKNHLTPDQREVLQESFETENFPEPEIIENLADCLAISKERVRRWFAKARFQKKKKQSFQRPHRNSLELVTESDSE